MAGLREINGVELEKMVQSGNKVLADFYSDTCGPCKMLSFVLEDVAKSAENVEIVKVNFDTNKEILAQYGVAAYPTMVLFENGQETARLKGLQQKPVILKAIQG